MPNNKQRDYAKSFIDEAQKKGGFKTLAGAVGMPDKEDWANIVRIINLYRKKSIKKYGKDVLLETIVDAKRERAQVSSKYSLFEQEYALVNKNSSMRHIFEFPEEFIRDIEKVYPLMFQDKVHFAWFCRNFAELRLVSKY